MSKNGENKNASIQQDENNNHNHDEDASDEYQQQIEFDPNEATKLTCDVLCSLYSSSGNSGHLFDTAVHGGGGTTNTITTENGSMDSDPDAMATITSTTCQTKSLKRSCPKQLQLPLFLSKTYHMIDRCDSNVASWSDSGDNFVVKDVDKFSCTVLPLYFKHSNFSSFARQLNFYGFRKLRSEAILTSELDPRTADYVRFYHEHFQRGKPQLLQNIKRATKAEQHSKDDLDSLKQEVTMLRDEIQSVKAEYNRKITELSYECNRRISSMNVEYDKLALFVQQSLGAAAVAVASGRSLVQQQQAAPTQPPAAPPTVHVPDLLQSLSQAAAMTLQLQPPPTAINFTPSSSSTTTDNNHYVDNTNNSTDAKQRKRSPLRESDNSSQKKQKTNSLDRDNDPIQNNL